MKPSCCLSDLVREVKKSSTEFITENELCKLKFNWQEGYGAFSYSHSQLDDMIGYIHKQKEHHKQKTFKEEYTGFLRKFNIEYEDSDFYQARTLKIYLSDYYFYFCVSRIKPF